jgi:carbonic anhydrase
MPYPFLYQNQHQAQAIALFCMDFRFKDATLDFLKHDLGLVDLDIVVLTGASKNIAAKVVQTSMSDLLDFKTTIKQFELSAKLHGIKKIILIDHQDCEAYGGSAAFEESEKEREAHIVNLHKAKAILKEKFKDKEIILFYARIIENEINFEKV